MEIPSVERQREIIDIVYNRGLNAGDLSVADQYLTPDYQSHGSYDDSVRGPASFKMTIAMQHRSFSDIKYEVLDVVSEGDKSAIRWVMRGRHTGPFIGIPPTGREIEHHAMIILRFEGDQIAERWGIVDNFTLMRTLQGAAPGPLTAVGGRPGGPPGGPPAGGPPAGGPSNGGPPNGGPPAGGPPVGGPPAARALVGGGSNDETR